jgi:uncharacterized DUF497 family protein
LKKSTTNKSKHGIDFRDAQELWNDPFRVIIPARTTDETRYLMIGKIMNKHWSAVYTYRGEAIRLISVRRSRKEEIELYEG